MPSQLTYLKINKFRHVRPGSAINFKPQFNVVVGQNGTGKTTLLNLASAIVRNNFHQFAREDFSIEFQLADGDVVLDGQIGTTSANNRAQFTFSGQLTWSGGVIRVESNDTESQIILNDQQFEAKSVTPVKSETEITATLIYAILNQARFSIPSFGWPLQFDMDDLFPPVGAANRLTEGGETFSELFGPTNRGTFPALGFSFIRIPDIPTITRGHALSPTMLSPEQSDSIDTSDIITLGRDILPLKRFVDLTQYEDARIILVKTATGKQADPGTVSLFASPLARFRTQSGSEIPHDQLSFGEKRLLTFLLKLYSYTPTVIVDELANGMHHSWLEQCVELIDDLGSQAFMTSQNPLLLDCLPLNRETYAAAHTLVICELTESGEMVWRNLTDAETEDFFRSLDVGLQHISEIMRAKGLW